MPKKSVFFFISSTISSETFLILRIIRRDIIRNAHASSGKVRAVFVKFESKLNKLDKYSKNI